MCNRHGQKVRDGLLFRSSRTESLTDDETDKFLKLGIKTIIDLRGETEYAQAGGKKVLDALYEPCVMKDAQDGDNLPARKRYFVSFITKDYLIALSKRINFIFRYCSFLLVIVDRLFGCHLTVKLYSHLVINQQTLAEWYMHILEHGKPVVAGIMRLLLKGGNVPVLINCAQGKDRTGMMVAMILGCLDVEDEAIALDYSLSEVNLV